MSRVLIIGDGLLGSELELQTGWDIVSRKLTNFDITDVDYIADILPDYDIVINCIANTNSYSSYGDEMYQVNVVFPYRLALACNRAGVKLAHISTEFVYTNNKGLPNEESLPLPDNTWYAHTKLIADEMIKLVSKEHLICRLLHKQKDFNPPEVWSVETSGDTVDKIAELVIRLIKHDAFGLYNVGTGSKWLSSLVKDKKCPILPPPFHIPTDTRMNLDKMNNFLNNIDLI